MEVIDGWKTKLRELTNAHLPQELQRQAIQPWPLLPHTFQAAVRKRRELIRVTRKWLGNQQRTIAAEKTDFSREAASVLTAQAHTADWVARKTDHAVWSRRGLEAVLVAAVAAAAVLMVLTSMQEARDERQRAEIRREAEEIAARRETRSAEEKRQAEAARLAGEAEVDRQMQAREAKRQRQAQAEEAERQAQVAREAQAAQQAQARTVQPTLTAGEQLHQEIEERAQQIMQQQGFATPPAWSQNQAAQRIENTNNESSSASEKATRLSIYEFGMVLYGTVPLKLGLAHGYITMRAGAAYEVRAQDADGTPLIYPSEWQHKGVVHIDSKHFDTSYDIERELQNGIRIKPEFLTVNKPR